MLEIDESYDRLSQKNYALRFILSLLIILIHSSWSETNLYFIKYNLSTNNFIFIQTLFRDGLCLCAVPLFFLFSGIFTTYSYKNYKKNLAKKVKSLFIPYLIWNTIAILYYLVISCVPNINEYVLSNPELNIREFTIFDFLRAYTGIFREGNYPILGTLWFIRDLFILNILIPGLLFLVRKLPHFYFLVLLLLYYLNINLYIINMDSVLFYSLGILICIYYKDVFEKIDKINILYFVFVFNAMFIMKCFFSNKILILLTQISSGLLLLSFSKILSNNEKVFIFLKRMSKYTFLIYALHHPFIDLFVKKLLVTVVGLSSWRFLFTYILTFLFISIITVLLTMCIYKFMPKLYTILSGGRLLRESK